MSGPQEGGKRMFGQREISMIIVIMVCVTECLFAEKKLGFGTLVFFVPWCLLHVLISLFIFRPWGIGG